MGWKVSPAPGGKQITVRSHILAAVLGAGWPMGQGQGKQSHDPGPCSSINLLSGFWRAIIPLELQLPHLKNGFTDILLHKNSEVTRITQDLREFLNLWS